MVPPAPDAANDPDSIAPNPRHSPLPTIPSTQPTPRARHRTSRSPSLDAGTKYYRTPLPQPTSRGATQSSRYNNPRSQSYRSVRRSPLPSQGPRSLTPNHNALSTQTR